MVAATPLAAQTPAPFPAASARLVLAAAVPPAPSLGPVPAAPSATAVRAAEARLRRLAAAPGALPATQRQRALAAMVLGTAEAQSADQQAAADLAQAAAWPPIRDAATAALVAYWQQSQDPAAAAALLDAANRYPLAPDDVFYPQISSAAAQAAASLQRWPEAVHWTEGRPATAAVIWLRAQAAAGQGQDRAAAQLERELVFRFPGSGEAALAAAPWQQYLVSMPDLAPTWQDYATQAAAWSAVGNPQRAAVTWARAIALAPVAQQPSLEAAEARALLAAGDLDAAAEVDQRLLASTERAQALEIQLELGRVQHAQTALAPALMALAAEFPTSHWYERALHEAGDEALVDADVNATLGQFDRLLFAFPRSVYAPGAAWQAAWAAYRLGRADTPLRLQHYLETYPQGQEAADALYWRGEWARAHQQPALAETCFRTAAQRFPGSYFGAQARLRAAAGSRGLAAGALPAWLAPFQADPPAPRATALPARFAPEVARAQALAQAGLAAPAAAILDGVLRRQPRGGPSLLLARQLAALDAARGDWHQGLEAMLRALPNYLELQPAQLRLNDWRLLFPVPYAADVRIAAQHYGLDRSLLLGVMRQESSFNPGDISSRRARGLMQLELATAGAPFRRLPPAWKRLAGPGPLRSGDLFNPALNLALGAAVLQQLLQRYPSPVYALAGYNAGESRVRQWQQTFAGLDPNAFIESIPFSQTRLYVQAVLRNQAHYARLYGPQGAPPGRSSAPRPGSK